MAPPKKLICDRCGATLDEKDKIAMALDGTASWHAFIKEQGNEPRGVFPCAHWIRCKGEMIAHDGKDKPRGG